MGTPDSAVILLSRQHLRPSLKNQWVQNLLSAAAYVKHNGWTLNSSIGTPNWEIITACAAIHHVPLRLFISKNSLLSRSEFINDFKLDTVNIDIIEISPIADHNNTKALWKIRDKTTVESADILIPISIRPKGHLASLLESAQIAGKRIIRNFQTGYVNTVQPLSYTINPDNLADEIKLFKNDYIIHWTRASNGPWPNETKFEFYSQIFNSNSYPRTGQDTLQRIVKSKIILASSRNMPGHTPTVSFSGLLPVETIKLMKWRARYNQMSFEPYGIGIEKTVAFAKGIKEVNYFDSQKNTPPVSVPQWLTQSSGRITDWRSEKEYRHLGDFDLSKLPDDKLVLFCRNKTEALILEDELKIKTHWFCD